MTNHQKRILLKKKLKLSRERIENIRKQWELVNQIKKQFEQIENLLSDQKFRETMKSIRLERQIKA